MHLWLLRPRDDLPGGDDPWDIWFDKNFGFVIRAETEEEARAMASMQPGDESCGEFLCRKTAKTTAPWLSPLHSTCVALTAEGNAGVIIVDFHAA